jgi:hypothetical protein
MAVISKIARPAYLPDITKKLTVHTYTTVQSLHKYYNKYPDIRQICLEVSYAAVEEDEPRGATISYHEYEKQKIIDENPLPLSFPFLPDRCVIAIPPNLEQGHNSSIMEAVVEAMRHTVHREIGPDGRSHFSPSSTTEIQQWMSENDPTNYPASTAAARGWKNSVNQCLTHGQGWNFVTYPPLHGSKIKRHMLVERAFNGSIVVGPGQCKSYNDQKGKKAKATSHGERVESTSSASSSSSALFCDLDGSASGSSSSAGFTMATRFAPY